MPSTSFCAWAELSVTLIALQTFRCYHIQQACLSYRADTAKRSRFTRHTLSGESATMHGFLLPLGNDGGPPTLFNEPAQHCHRQIAVDHLRLVVKHAVALLQDGRLAL